MATRFVLYKGNLLNEDTAVDLASESINIENYRGYAVFASHTSLAPTAKSFAEADVNVTANTIAEPAHGYLTGLKGQFTTTTTLPAGLSLTTDYYIIKVDANTYKVATTEAHAISGTAIDLTDDGTGTHTFTPSAVSATVKIQGSLDNINFADITGTTSSISATGSLLYNIEFAYYRYARVVYTMTAGQLTVLVHLSAKGH